MKNLIILFSGRNQRSVIAFVRTLERHKLAYAIIANTKNDSIFLTPYARNVCAVRTQSPLNAEEVRQCIATVKKKIPAERYVVVPATESLNRILLHHKKQLEDDGCDVPIVSAELYETISDKLAFTKKCAAAGIDVPVEYSSIAKTALPYVAKPRTYLGRKGTKYDPILILTASDHRQFLQTHDIEDFYFQEFVDGSSFYLLYYFFRDGTHAKFSQQNYVQQPHGKSIIAAEASDFHLSAESAKYAKLFSSLGYFGLVMVEVKRCKDKNYMIEANPKFWGPSQLFIDAGVNLFDAFLYDNKLIATKPTVRKIAHKTKYFWLGGYIETLKSGGKLAYHNYNNALFAEHFAEWLSAELFNKEDTKEIFVQEFGGNVKSR